MTHKTITGVRVKDADAGTVEAVFSTFGVIDKDGDVTHKTSFTEGAEVVISAYGHTSWDGQLPIGKGTIRLTDTEAILDGEFFVDTTHGLDAFRTVKHLGELQEWSYSLHDVESEATEVDGVKARSLLKIRVKECSPVLVGASVNTRTLAAKAHKQVASSVAATLRAAGQERWGGDDTEYLWLDDWDVDESWAVFAIESSEESRLVRVSFTRDGDDVTLGDEEAEVQRTVNYAPKSGARFIEHANAVLADVDALTTRTSEVVALRASKGKQLADSSVDLLARIAGSLDRLKAAVEAGTTPTTASDAALKEFMRSIAIAQGVTS